MLRIKEIIKEKGLTGKEVAEKLEITENSFSLIANEKRQPRYETLAQIADTLGVDIRDLFQPTKPENQGIDLYQKNERGEFERFGTLIQESK